MESASPHVGKIGRISATCSAHGPLSEPACEPCIVAAIANRILDKTADYKPLKAADQMLLATYALRSVAQGTPVAPNHHAGASPA